MPVKQCQKMGLVMDVKSVVLGETVVFAPTTEVAGETRVVYTWREGFIIAKAQPETGLMRFVHEVKRQFPGSMIETITIGASGKHAGVQMSGEAAPRLKPEMPSGEQSGSYWQANDAARSRRLEEFKLADASPKSKPKEDGIGRAKRQQPAVPEPHLSTPPAPGPEASDVYLVDDPQLLTGSSLESLLPRRPSPAAGI